MKPDPKDGTVSSQAERRAERVEFIEERFLRHLEKLNAEGFKLRCPVCGHTEFTVEQTEAPGSWEESSFESVFSPKPVVPRLPIVCRRCFYVLEFAWLPIRMTTERL